MPHRRSALAGLPPTLAAVRAGKRVAICDQLEDPKLVKGIVKRGITELVTPGVSFNDKILNHQQNNFLASIHFEKENGKILQVDICGECDPDKSMESPKNDHANKELLRFWKKWF